MRPAGSRSPCTAITGRASVSTGPPTRVRSGRTARSASLQLEVMNGRRRAGGHLRRARLIRREPVDGRRRRRDRHGRDAHALEPTVEPRLAPASGHDADRRPGEVAWRGLPWSPRERSTGPASSSTGSSLRTLPGSTAEDGRPISHSPRPASISSTGVNTNSTRRPSRRPISVATSTSKPDRAPAGVVTWGRSGRTAIRMTPRAWMSARRVDGFAPASNAPERISDDPDHGDDQHCCHGRLGKAGEEPERALGPGAFAIGRMEIRRRQLRHVGGFVRWALAECLLDPSSLIARPRPDSSPSRRRRVAVACVAWLRAALAVIPITDAISSNDRSAR